MNAPDPEVDRYLKEGCGRCPLVGTPECKVHNWPETLRQLRLILLNSELLEEFKWKQPCYTLNGSNVLLLTAFKDYAALAFFKGALMKDTQGLMKAPGENSQAVRQLRFTSATQLAELEPVIRAYVQEALTLERAGAKVEFKKEPEPVPEELEQEFKADPAFRAAFEGLTPGRQRGYILHFSQPKQSQTRTSRIVKCREKIMAGKGLTDYK